jgi:hypothetical protein
MGEAFTVLRSLARNHTQRRSDAARAVVDGASARTITLPLFLVTLLREHVAATAGRRSEFVFTSLLGYPLRRSDFHRRTFGPAADGNRQHPNAKVHTEPVRPGLTFHGQRHSHKPWLIADDIPEIAQARRLGHHLSNRIIETYSHVAPEIERNGQSVRTAGRRSGRFSSIGASLGLAGSLVAVMRASRSGLVHRTSQTQPSFSKIQITLAEVSSWPRSTPWRAQVGSA